MSLRITRLRSRGVRLNFKCTELVWLRAILVLALIKLIINRETIVYTYHTIGW